MTGVASGSADPAGSLLHGLSDASWGKAALPAAARLAPAGRWLYRTHGKGMFTGCRSSAAGGRGAQGPARGARRKPRGTASGRAPHSPRLLREPGGGGEGQRPHAGREPTAAAAWGLGRVPR